jgi:hypothetical protein
MSDPDILIIDELSLGLAPFAVHQLLVTLKRLKEEGLTFERRMGRSLAKPIMRPSRWTMSFATFYSSCCLAIEALSFLQL